MGCFDGFSCKKRHFWDLWPWQETRAHLPLTEIWNMDYRLIKPSCVLCMFVLHKPMLPKFTIPWIKHHLITSIKNFLTSVKLFSSLRCLKEVTIFVWKSFHFKKNCWSAILAVFSCISFFQKTSFYLYSTEYMFILSVYDTTNTKDKTSLYVTINIWRRAI